MREENAHAIAASRKPNGTQTKYVEVDVAELQSTVIAIRGEIDALRGQVESLASQVVALTEDVLDTRAHTKNLPAVQAPQAGGEAPWWAWVDRCHSPPVAAAGCSSSRSSRVAANQNTARRTGRR